MPAALPPLRLTTAQRRAVLLSYPELADLLARVGMRLAMDCDGRECRRERAYVHARVREAAVELGFVPR